MILHNFKIFCYYKLSSILYKHCHIQTFVSLADPVLEKKESLGEILNGDRLANALHNLEFAVNKTQAVLCQRTLNKGNVSRFRESIKNGFYYQMYFDDLPLWAYIGKVEHGSLAIDGHGPKYFLFTHVQFDALYNGNQVIEVHALGHPSHAVDVTADVDLEIKFTYSVSWKGTSAPYKDRMDRYWGASLLPVIRQTHLFSFVNFFIMLILLLGLLAVIFMRHLKNDLRKWSIGDDDEEKEVGWKYIHGDVFRCPTNLPYFSALFGCGTQVMTMVSFLFALAFLGVFYPYSSGALSISIFISYIITSAVAGYSSASVCSQHFETGWEKSVLLAGTLFLGPYLFTVFILNILSTYHGVTATLPLGTIFFIFLIFVLVSIPLLILGGFLGHRYKSDPLSSPVTRKCPREIPVLAWYRKTPAQMFIAGLLPFSVIVLEFHNLCATLWGYKIYTSPGILFITFVMLVVLTALFSVGLTYFQLTVEDHEWWWRSMLRGGSTAIFMFCHCIYFYAKSNMSGILQTSFFFGYSFCLCYAFFLMLGAVSFQASFLFVRRIYHTVKSE
ncbi:Transmembrane 9 superfamily member 5 [Striga hermonthica]|uniref:Transmembrane 9 superfamily member n=1 Tax=Striga hermonthica TaxID=68872 RepID=A0A9N7R4J4_STRHE|nr:Transmembrane 9 superfamily member 5 [Striga hermonthica]